MLVVILQDPLLMVLIISYHLSLKCSALSTIEHKSSQYRTTDEVESVEDRVKFYRSKDGMQSYKDHPKID
jgi:hypothetical protein